MEGKIRYFDDGGKSLRVKSDDKDGAEETVDGVNPALEVKRIFNEKRVF
jgi:hypothetical protein